MSRSAGVLRIAVYFARLVAAVSVGASMIGAQTPIPGGEPQVPIPAGDAQSGSVGSADRTAAQGDAKGPSLTWNLGVDIGEGYDSNVLFADATDPGDESSRLHANLALGVRAARGTVAVTGDGSGLLYRQERGLNQFTYAFGAKGTYDLSPRLTARVDGAERTSLSTDVSALGPGLPFLPLALSRTTAGSLGLSDRMSPRTTATVDASYTGVSFGTTGLANGETGTARLTVMHLLAPDASLGVTVVSEEIWTSSVQWTPSAEAIGDTHLGPFVLRLHAGAATLLGERTAAETEPIGGADFQYPAGRGAIEFRFDRGVNEVFGLGAVYITDALGLAYTHPAVLGFSVRVGADQSWGTYAGPQSQQLEATGASVQLRRQLTATSWIGVGGYLRRRIQGVLVSDQGVLVSAGYAVSR